MNEIGIIISRYWQTLKWIENLKGPLDVYVYNRRGTGPPKFIFQPNYQTEEDKQLFQIGKQLFQFGKQLFQIEKQLF